MNFCQFKSKLSNVFVTALLAMGVVLYFAINTIAPSYNEFGYADLNYLKLSICLLLALFFAMSSIFIFIDKKMVSIPIKIGFCLLISISIFSVNWSMVESFQNINMISIILLIILASFLFFVIFSSEFNIQFGLLFLIICVNFYSFYAHSNEIITLSGDSEIYEGVEFRKKPNVYFISFDSIQPKSLTSKYMNIEEAPFHEIIYSKFDRFDNLFSARVPTKASLNSILAMDIKKFDSLGKKRFEYYTGLRNSPLMQIFKDNGYEVNTTYASKYFGSEKGRYLDRYNILADSTGACEFNQGRFREISLFGLCGMIDNGIIKKQKQDRSEKLIGFISYLSEKRQPQFLLAYQYSPGHTNKDFSIDNDEAVDDYRTFYLNRSIDTAETMRNLIETLKEKDPTALLYVFGDHGPWRSRGGRKKVFASDPEFYVHDRMGILGGIYPKGSCAEFVSARNQQAYTTSIQGAETILKCLTNGDYKEIDQLYDIKPSIKGISSSFEDYLYE